MSEFLEMVWNTISSNISIANVSAVLTFVAVAANAFAKLKKAKNAAISPDVEKEYEELKKENAEIQDSLDKTKKLLSLMINHSRLSDEAKCKAEDILEGKVVNTVKEVVENVVSDETVKTVVDRLTKELEEE